ncbi:MAG: MFS transporter [Candidatus Dormiibacterota bacterium]
MTVVAQTPAAAVDLPRLGVPRIVLLSSYWVALGFLWLPLGGQVIPIFVLHIVGDGLKGTGTAVLEAFGTLVAVFWQPVMGALSDRTHTRFGRRKPFIFVGTIGSMLFLGLMALTPQFGNATTTGPGALLAPAYLWLLLLYFLLQLSENAAQAPYQGLLPDVVPEEERSRASSFVGAGNLVGIGVGVVVVGTLMGMGRPELALLTAAGALGLTMLIVVLVFADKVPPAAGGRISWRELVVDTFRISPSKHGDFLWLMASRLAILVAVAGLQRYAVYYFKDVFYPGSGAVLEEHASLAARDLQGVILGVAILVSLPAGELSHRVGRKPLIVASGILGAIGTVGLIGSPFHLLPDFATTPVAGLLGVPQTLAQAMYFGVLVGLAAGMFLSVDWAFMVDLIPHQESGRFLGFSNIATAGSGVLAGLLGGFLIDAFNARGHLLGQPGGYPVTFAVYTVFFILGTFAVLKVRETRRGGRSVRPPLAAGH